MSVDYDDSAVKRYTAARERCESARKFLVAVKERAAIVIANAERELDKARDAESAAFDALSGEQKRELQEYF